MRSNKVEGHSRQYEGGATLNHKYQQYQELHEFQENEENKEIRKIKNLIEASLEGTSFRMSNLCSWETTTNSITTNPDCFYQSGCF